MLLHDGRANRSNWRCDRWLVQNSEEAPSIAPLNGRGPGIGACGGQVPFKIEDLNYTLPYWLPDERLLHRHRLDKASGAVVLALDGLPKFFRH